MKFYALLFAFLLAGVAKAQNIAELEEFEKAMKPGTVLSYDVSANGKQYKFIVTVKKLGADIGFDWEMTAPVNKKGSVSMSAAAVSGADALYNYFAGGALSLDKETSVWISKKNFKEVQAEAQTSLRINGASDTVTVMSNTVGEFGFNLNGNFITVPGMELQGGSDPKYTVAVIESDKFPVIFRMDLGWTIMLTEVKSQ